MAVGNNGLLDGIRQIPARLRALDILGGQPGAPFGYRLRGATKAGPPVSGTWRTGDIAPDRQGTFWTCVAGGSPGQWASTSQVTSIMTYGADPTGSSDSTEAIQNTLLSFGTLGSWSQGHGGIAYVPPGYYKTSKPLIVPSGVEFAGSGWGSQLALATDSQCDMVQFATHASSAQAAILGVSTSGIANAYYAKVRNIALHGDAFTATVPAYFHGINITTDPVSTAATGPGADPSFDPMQTIENVWIKACTGDAVNHENGRSGALLKRIYADSCNGLAFALGTDTSVIACIAGFCGGGFYANHTSNVGSGCKSYNNGIGQWVSGFAYATGYLTIYNGAMYWCTASVTSATVPSSDPTHWTELTAATAPWATGKGYYFDTNAGEQSWAGIDSQENCEGDYYIAGPNNGAISIDGTCSNTNFNNGQPDYNSSNPNHYAAVTFDGVSGANVRLSTKTNPHGTVCTSLNSPGSNTLIAVTDGTEAAVFSGAPPTFAVVNGAVQSVLQMASGSDTSGTAAASSPSFTTATAKQLSTVQDVDLYISVTTAATFTIALGPTSTPANAIVNSKALAVGQVIPLHVPKGWYVEITGTIADLSITQVTR